jgi:hypothetical protein
MENNNKQISSIKNLWNKSNWSKLLIILLFPFFLVFAMVSYIIESEKISSNKKSTIITCILIFMIWISSSNDKLESGVQDNGNFENEFRACERQRDDISKQKDLCLKSKETVTEVNKEVVEEKQELTIQPQSTESETKENNIFISREEALAIVKENAEQKWDTDYSMVKYEIDKQMQAYDWLVKQTDNLDIMRKAEQKWDTDYSMIKYEYEKQLEAYRSL